jgi:hypothetical protein
MRLNDALVYLNYGIKEGFIDEEYAETLLQLPWDKFIREIEIMQAKGDDWADAVVKGEM